jgi:hypothetical protein
MVPVKISGFTFARNTAKLYYPIKESIQSILPLVDEFVIALGDGDADDKTRDEILSIRSDKIKIIDTIWDIVKYPRGTEHAHQTDIAKEACSGDWLFYIQADEVVHEDDLPTIRDLCEKYLNDSEVEGFLFKYLHFYGDYRHRQVAHGWYPFEIRIIRNQPDIHSWESAQSFRRIPDFDGLNYRRDKKGTHKLKVVNSKARIFHYGWVRPPHYMESKSKVFNTNHFGVERANEMFSTRAQEFQYGSLKSLPKYKDSHPRVMEKKIQSFDWGDKLNLDGHKEVLNRQKNKQEKLKYRILTFIEQNMLGGHQIGGFKNYIKINR